MVSSVLRHGFFLLAPPSLLILIEIMRMREVEASGSIQN